MKGADGKPLFRNYSQQRRFRESQEFLQIRYNVRSIDPTELLDAGSDLEGAAFELTRDPNWGQGGTAAFDAQTNSRLGELLDAVGAPDYYFWRFWYSETGTK